MIARSLLIVCLSIGIGLALSYRQYPLASACTVALLVPFSPNVFRWRHGKRMATPNRREGHV